MTETLDPSPRGDYFLRAADEASLQAALATMGLWMPVAIVNDRKSGGYITGGMTHALDVIGDIWKQSKDASGALLFQDDNGMSAPVMEKRPGFHANLRWASDEPLSPELAALALTPEPATPSRVFA